MSKKIFIMLFVLFSLLFVNTTCFATTIIAENSMQNAGDTMKNALQDAGNNIKNGAQNLGDDVKNGVQNGGNAIKDMTNNGNTNNPTTPGENMGINTPTDYTASRTSTAGDSANTGTMWTWIIVALIAVVIIGIMWYYMAKNTRSNNR